MDWSVLTVVFPWERGDWCGFDTGHTTITDRQGNRHSVFISLTRDGGLWARLGQEHKSQDWHYHHEPKRRFQTTILDEDALSFLRNVHYTDFCVLSDLELQVWAEGGWHPSYLNVFDAVTKETKIVLFKISDNCMMQTNFSLSADKQGLFCDGGRANTCGLRSLPERRHKTKTNFLHFAKLDPIGPDHKRCELEITKNMYSFTGSYYHVYVKLADCKPPWESRAFGHEAKLRAFEEDHENTIIIPDPTQTAISDGVIIGWQVFNKIVSIEHEVYIQVWRPLDNLLKTFTLVGETFYQPTELRSHEVVLRQNQYINIRKGDILGMYFPQKNPFAWDSVPCAYQLQRYRYIDRPTDVASGLTKEFRTAHGGPHACRQYSFQALFANKSDARLVHDWICPTAKPRYEIGELNNIDLTGDTDTGTKQDKNSFNTSLDITFNGLIPLHLILIIAGCLILMLIIVGVISYYRAVRS